MRHEVQDHDVQRMNDDALFYFKEEFPILFECLEAKFGLMPSTTRIVEQKHGGVQMDITGRQSLCFIDISEQYKTNVEYGARESRQKIERERATTRKRKPDENNFSFLSSSLKKA